MRDPPFQGRDSMARKFCYNCLPDMYQNVPALNVDGLATVVTELANLLSQNLRAIESRPWSGEEAGF